MKTAQYTIQTVIVERPRSKRIETRTKGKRKLKRIHQEMAQQIREELDRMAVRTFFGG